MKRFSATSLISLGLTFLTVSLLLTAQSLGLVPDERVAVAKSRAQLCEMLAAQCSVAAARNDVRSMGVALAQVVGHAQEVTSATVVRSDGKTIHKLGSVESDWKGVPPNISTPEHVQLPILQNGRQWGVVRVCFRASQSTDVFGGPGFRFILFVGAGAFGCFSLYLKRVLRHMDPSSVIPGRVRAILDSLAEGVIVLDRGGRIVMANEAFAKATGRDADALQGRSASDIHWTQPDGGAALSELPWQPTLTTGETCRGVPLGLDEPGTGRRTFMVNAAPILGVDGSRRGAMATFDDVTSVEDMNGKLRNTLELLQQSRDEVDRQNRELHILASSDPLTGCYNRRSFMQNLERCWKSARQAGGKLACVMVDVDRFKSINDAFGHSVGDQVLREVAEILRSTARPEDLVCRYGGEEFCLIMPAMTIPEATRVAEVLRRRIAHKPWGLGQVTASLGVSGMELNPEEPSDLLDQADRALYAAKRRGRDRVVSADEVRDEDVTEPKREGAAEATDPQDERRIEDRVAPQVVEALMTSLAHRDRNTAEHCRRVAALCVAVGSEFLPKWQCRLLEFGALLHDIGKLGTPDAVLLKPGPLNDDEWKIMRAHEHHGIEIIKAAFNHPELLDIVGMHHAWFGGNPNCPDLPTGQNIPVGARILTIADAYDAMISDRVYRKGRPPEQAMAELRRCAGTQFDPELVERFIAAVNKQRVMTGRATGATRIDRELAALAASVGENHQEVLAAAAKDVEDLAALVAGSTSAPLVAPQPATAR
jgi:diguanylate cyclase (GGDEF)-like protein/PAS domain S-box-containing protein/putative nucleotidyltransferase with HDIG domain